VDHERSFTKAAAVLGVSQPAVSQNVAELERLVGAKLFERLRGEVALTGEGEVFKQYAEKMLASCTGLDNMFAKIAPTVVRISASEELYNYMVSPALESFRKIHPEVIFERAMFEGADLLISLKPVPSSAYDIPADSIARIRMSVFPTPTVGSVLGGSASGSQSGSRSVSGSQSFERTSCFDVLFQPTPLFACTRLCRLIREFLVGAKI
jgi:hypothetical protein